MGDFEFVDATNEEELCNGSKTTIAVNESGKICAIEKNGGSLSTDEFKTILGVSYTYDTIFTPDMQEYREGAV